MTPSLFSLFKRGRYFTAAQDDGQLDQDVAQREERERFAVAALAFCLKHEPTFRRHFWNQICRVPDDPAEMPPITAADIHIEPPEWADLSLTSDTSAGRFMWVIEAKAGAELQPKQNPTRSEFAQPPTGYGWQFAGTEEPKGTKMRYVVLGAEAPLDLRPHCGPLGIWVQQKSWRDLLEGVERVGMVRDLIETLAQLKIGEFYMEKARNITVTHGIQSVGNAWRVLDALCEYLGVRKTYRDFDAASSEDGTGSLGVYIQQPPPKKSPSSKHRRLQEVTRQADGCLAWLGYEFDAVGKVEKSVWLYCSDDRERDRLHRRLRPGFPSAGVRNDQRDHCVVITSPSGIHPGDFEWFQSVIDRALRD